MTLVESIVIEMASADGEVDGSTYLDESLQKAINKTAIRLGMKYALPVGGDVEELTKELFQIGCETAARYSRNYDSERVNDMGETATPMTYLYKCAWGAMMKRCKEYYNENKTNVSMDAPIGEPGEDEEDSGTMHDIVADENSPNPGEELDRDESTKAITAALRQLPRRQRYIITRIYGIGCEEKTQRVLAQELGITFKQVWHEMNRARNTLRALLKDFAPV